MRAFVISGGGPLAAAWHVGMLAGLAEEGVSLEGADFILGTSAGAIVGARMRAGHTPAEMAAAVISETAPRARFNPDAMAQLPNIFAMARSGGDDDGAAARAEVGKLALTAATADPEDVVVARFVDIIGPALWPEKPFGAVAIDAESGVARVLDASAHTELARAAAASAAIPTISSPITIGQRRYMDGGLRSSANADLALGYEKVLVFSFRANGKSGVRIAAELEKEMSELRAHGAQTLAVSPDAATLEAVGPSAWDGVRRPGIARAAIEQGRAFADTLRRFW